VILINIFLLDEDLTVNAQYMVDKHVVKMPTESAQILCTVLNQCNQESPYNWKYLRELALEICKEYTYRYGKIHKAETIINSLEEPRIASIGLTKQPSCMDKQFIIGENTIDNYRNYYNVGKRHLHSWKNRNKPCLIS
jgi:hypothetical protein